MNISMPTFDEIYRLSKRHAAKFGWSRTNADVRFVAAEHGHICKGTPALGDLQPYEWKWLQEKWELDLKGEGHPPAVDYETFRTAVYRHRDRFGMEATKRRLKELGGSEWPNNIKHALRAGIIAKLEQEIAEDIQRARKVAGRKSPKSPDQTGWSYSVAAQRVLRNPLPNDESAVKRALDLFKKKVGPHYRASVTAEISDDETHELRNVSVGYGARVRLANDGWGIVTSLRIKDGVCNRLVVLMDDLRTRVLEHGNAVSFYVRGVRYHSGGVPSRKPAEPQLFNKGEYVLPNDHFLGAE